MWKVPGQNSRGQISCRQQAEKEEFSKLKVLLLEYIEDYKERRQSFCKELFFFLVFCLFWGFLVFVFVFLLIREEDMTD